MRILHTADIHVGKTLRGRSRIPEHRELFAELTRIVEQRDVDLVLIAGDVFDTAAPSAEAEEVVYDGVLALVNAGAKVAIIAGNHDNPRRWSAVTRLMKVHGVAVSSFVAPPDQGGVVDIETRSGIAQVAFVPFVSQRNIVKADDLMSLDRDEHSGEYQERLRLIMRALASAFDPAHVNVMVGHLTVAGENGVVLGGGERRAHTVFDYHVSPHAFPPEAQYVALGHLHAEQRIAGPTHVRYSGSPMHLDFSDTPEDKVVLLIDVEPGGEPTVEKVPVRAGRRLVTLRGTIAQCTEQAERHSDALYRVQVVDDPRPGLADEVRQAIGDVIDVHVVAGAETAPAEADWDPGQAMEDPGKLWGEFLDAKGVDDPRVDALFRVLLEEHASAHHDDQPDTPDDGVLADAS